MRHDRVGDCVELAGERRPRDRRADREEHAHEPARDPALPAVARDPAAGVPAERDRTREHAEPDRPAHEHAPRPLGPRRIVAAARGEPEQRAADRIPQRVEILRDEQEHEVAEQHHHRGARDGAERVARSRQRVQEEHRDQKQRIVWIREQHYGAGSAGGSGAVGDGGGGSWNGLLGGMFCARRQRS
jgi:hypothetical protein